MKHRNRSSRFAWNAIANWCAFLVVAGIGFFLSPFIVRSLGNVAYGVWAVLGSLVGYLGLLDFGVRGAVTRFVAHHHAASDPLECSRIVSAGIGLFGSLGAVAVICAFVIASTVTFLFNVPEALVDDTRIVIILGGVTVAITLIGGIFGGVVAGLQRFDIVSGIEILITSIRAGVIILALDAGCGLITLALIQLLSSVLSGGAAWVAARKLYPTLQLEFRGLWPSMRRLLSFGVWSSLIQVSAMLIYYSDTVVIAVFLPIGLVTFFAIATSLCDYARQVTGALSTIMTPHVSAMNAVSSGAVEPVVCGVARIATLVVTPIAMTFWWRGESFINLWMGPDYGTLSGQVLELLAVVVWLGGARSIATSTIMGVNRHRLLMPAIGLEAGCNLGLSIVLVGVYGLIGVAIGTLIPSVLMTLVYLPWCLQKTTGVSARMFYRDAWVLPTIACIPFALATLLLERYIPAQSLSIFVMQVGMILPLVPAMALALCATQSEREQVLSIVKGGGLIGQVLLRVFYQR